MAPWSDNMRKKIEKAGVSVIERQKEKSQKKEHPKIPFTSKFKYLFKVKKCVFFFL